MTLKQKSAEAPAAAKKRKIVSFAKTDHGIEANECIKIFLVSSQDEVASMEGFCIDPIGLNQYFGEAGVIYGYKDLKINIWVSTVSFHAYADISYASTADGGKGITDLKPGLENIFGEVLLDKNEFLQTFSTESRCVGDIVSAGTVLGGYSLGEDGESSNTHPDQSTAEHEIVRMNLHSLPVGLLYSRLVPLTLLLIDGSSPIDVMDPGWDVYFVVKRVQNQSADYELRLLGFALIYRFYHHPDSTRLRLSLILVLPPHQGLGHGRRLLESVNAVAIAENVYDLTMEEPSEYLQYLRSCLDTLRLLDFEPIKPAVNTAASSLMTDSVSKKPSKSPADPPAHAVEIARQKLKINKKQFLRCWEILLYLKLDPKNIKSMENFRASIAARAERDILNNDIGIKGKRLIEMPNDYDHDMTFVLYFPLGGEDSDEADGRLDGENGADQRKQLNKMVDKQLEEIAEIAERVSLLRSC